MGDNTSPTVTLTFILFDDLLLATREKGKKRKKKLVYAFGLDRMLVKDVVKLDDSGMNHYFFLFFVCAYYVIAVKTMFELWTFQNDKKINLQLLTNTQREKEHWIAAINKATLSKANQLYEMVRKLSLESANVSSTAKTSSSDIHSLQFFDFKRYFDNE